ncbi:MAG: hypothetical protein FWF81_11790 [Defluviitaleaceae bacterium]|nr:hypothetical protein [Defluviitaleaceae bacterium]
MGVGSFGFAVVVDLAEDEIPLWFVMDYNAFSSIMEIFPSISPPREFNPEIGMWQFIEE